MENMENLNSGTLIILGFNIIIMIFCIKISKRFGRSGLLSLWFLIPVIGPLIFWLFLATTKIPKHGDSK